MTILQDPKAYAEKLFDFHGQQGVPLETVFDAARNHPQVPASFWAAVARELNITGWLLIK